MRQRVSMQLLAAAAMVVGAIAIGVPAASAADPEVRWEREAGIELESVVLTDGGAVVTGRFLRSGEQHPSMLLRKVDPSGDVVWTRAWHPQGTRVNGVDVTVGPDGAIYVVGDIARANLEGGGFFIRKYGPAGGFLWKDISDGGYGRGVGVPEVATGVAVHGTNVVITGHEYGCCGAQDDDGWIRLYRSSGSLRWHRNFEVPGVSNDTNDRTSAVAADATGLYVAGRVEMTPRADDSERVDMELVVQQLGYDGARRWSWIGLDAGVRDEDTVTDLALRDGRLIATGTVNGTRWTLGQGWLARFTTGGDPRWQRTWGRPIDGIRPASVSITPTRTLVVTGWRRGDGPLTSATFLRTFAIDGTARAKAILGQPPDSAGTGVAAHGDTAYVSGWVEVSRDEHGGRLWRWRI